MNDEVRSVLDSLPIPLLVWGVDDVENPLSAVLVYANEESVKSLGRNWPSLIGKPVGIVCPEWVEKGLVHERLCAPLADQEAHTWTPVRNGNPNLLPSRSEFNLLPVSWAVNASTVGVAYIPSVDSETLNEVHAVRRELHQIWDRMENATTAEDLKAVPEKWDFYRSYHPTWEMWVLRVVWFLFGIAITLLLAFIKEKA